MLLTTRVSASGDENEHDDVTRPEDSMGFAVTLKSKMAASSANSGGNSKIIVSFCLSESSNKSPSRYSTA